MSAAWTEILLVAAPALVLVAGSAYFAGLHRGRRDALTRAAAPKEGGV